MPCSMQHATQHCSMPALQQHSLPSLEDYNHLSLSMQDTEATLAYASKAAWSWPPAYIHIYLSDRDSRPVRAAPATARLTGRGNRPVEAQASAGRSLLITSKRAYVAMRAGWPGTTAGWPCTTRPPIMTKTSPASASSSTISNRFFSSALRA